MRTRADLRTWCAPPLLLTALLAGCGGAGGSGSAGAAVETSSPSAGAGSAASPAPPAGDAAADVPERLRFSAPTVGGGSFDGASLAGKPAVLWFWAPWCPKCRAEAPGIKAAAEAGGAEFVGVAAQDTEEAMRDFVERYDLGGFPHVADTDAAIWRRFEVTYQPAYAFVGADGSIDVVKDQLSADELAERIGRLG